jgi:hypothetical protein
VQWGVASAVVIVGMYRQISGSMTVGAVKG